MIFNCFLIRNLASKRSSLFPGVLINKFLFGNVDDHSHVLGGGLKPPHTPQSRPLLHCDS